MQEGFYSCFHKSKAAATWHGMAEVKTLLTKKQKSKKARQLLHFFVEFEMRNVCLLMRDN